MTAAIGLSLAERLRSSAVSGSALVQRGSEGVLPVLSPLAALLPWGGLRRGSTVTVTGSSSLLLSLLAGASRSGSWCAVVGIPSLCAVAAAEAGVVIERLAFVPDTGSDAAGVIAALLDGLDVVAVGNLSRLSSVDSRRLTARARQRGVVLLPYGSWPGADLDLSCDPGRWHGIDAGHGYLREREVTVSARGRGSASRPRTVRVVLPSPEGDLAVAATEVISLTPARAG
jgi:hypothetical protein